MVKGRIRDDNAADNGIYGSEYRRESTRILESHYISTDLTPRRKSLKHHLLPPAAFEVGFTVRPLFRGKSGDMLMLCRNAQYDVEAGF